MGHYMVGSPTEDRTPFAALRTQSLTNRGPGHEMIGGKLQSRTARRSRWVTATLPRPGAETSHVSLPSFRTVGGPGGTRTHGVCITD